MAYGKHAVHPSLMTRILAELPYIQGSYITIPARLGTRRVGRILLHYVRRDDCVPHAGGGMALPVGRERASEDG